MKDLKNVKGTRDFSFEDSFLIDNITNIIKQNLEGNGYSNLYTPHLESLKVLYGKYDSDAEIITEIFKVSNRAEREIGLRYDLTVPLCRFISQNLMSIKFPFKRYQFANVFRDGPIKKGRSREFMQFDFDCVGDSSIENQADGLITFFNTYKKLKVDATIEINNMKILKGAFLQNDFPEKDLDRIALSVDKLKKIGKEKVVDEIVQKGFSKQKIENSIEILSSKNFEELKKLAKNKILKEGIFELEKLLSYIKNELDYKVNFSMSRGLNIYTSNIWEVLDKKNIVSSSIGSGGVYNDIIGNYLEDKKTYEAFGFSFGILSIFEILKTKNKNLKKSNIDLLIAVLTDKNIEEIFKIKKQLIENYNCNILFKTKLKKAFSYCDSYNIENICFIGNKEIKNKKIMIKNLITKKEKEVKTNV